MAILQVPQDQSLPQYIGEEVGQENAQKLIFLVDAGYVEKLKKQAKPIDHRNEFVIMELGGEKISVAKEIAKCGFCTILEIKSPAFSYTYKKGLKETCWVEQE